ncbi:ribonuclease H-like domain-containing protein [Chloroflexota bacterium]
MIRIRPSSLRRSPGKLTLFSQLGSPALDQVSRAGPAGQSYVPLSGLLHVCAYLYETGAVLGHASKDRLLELVSMSFAAEEVQHCLAELRHLLRRRLETSGKYAHSFYTYYLHGTMRNMNMNFDINGMREAHHNIRDKTEACHFLEYAGAEGLLLGGWYPDLAEKMYGKGYGAQEDIINEMTRGVALLPEETTLTSIRERRQLVLNKVSAYISQYHPDLAETPRVTGNEKHRIKGKRPEMEPEQLTEAYLDIETTGLTPAGCDITVIGIHICNNGNSSFTQLVGKDIAEQSILEALQGVSVLYTYNGSRFDLPFIQSRLGINLAKVFTHIDLMYHCWRKNLYGGLKSVERQLGIERRLVGIDGYEAVKLWWRYVDSFDLDALNTLLEYNKEDVVNLKSLKERLI